MKVYHTIYSDPEFEQECQALKDAGYDTMLCASHRAQVALSTLWHAILEAMPFVTVQEG